MAEEMINSGSDERTRNNVMRHEYKILSEEEKQQMKDLKDIGEAFLLLLHRVGNTKPDGGRFASRELSLAGTKMEEAVMWSVKHVTGSNK